jgi:hypothetical protein
MIIFYMVHLQAGSAVDQTRYPHSYRWDTAVRKHYDRYQELIDSAAYRLQRIQRGWLVPTPLVSPSPTPNSTTQNSSNSKSYARNRKWDKSTRTKSTSIKTSNPPSPPISTGPSDTPSFFQPPDSQWALAS